jgi:hypothetical protein
MSYPNILTSFNVPDPSTFTVKANAIKLENPQWYADYSPAVTLTCANFQRLIDVVQSVVDWSTQAKADVLSLQHTVGRLETQGEELKRRCDELELQNKELQNECDGLRIACTAVSEAEIKRLKESFASHLENPENVLK